jgi:hypothetical protein
MMQIWEIVNVITDTGWSRFKKFMALVALGMMIQNI